MRVVVLGAGVIGVTSAWYLAKDGHEVTVIERQSEAALETSFANGGQISVSHAEPWANPAAPRKILQWLGREDSPLLWRLRADTAQWAWGCRFLRECLSGRTRKNMQALVALGLYSRDSLNALCDELSLDYDQQKRGILHIYTDANEYSHACTQAELMRQFGCESYPVSAEECLRIEPALGASAVKICGGTFTARDESGDAHKFTQQLAAQASQVGVEFRYGESVSSLPVQGGRVTSVRLNTGEDIVADAYLVACGSYSPEVLRTAGVNVAIYPAKGYSVTFDLSGGIVAPTVSLTDDGRKLVFSRLGNRLRVAGTAEFTGYDTSINALRCAAISQRATAFFPSLAEADSPESWAGLRPATPGNVPLIGKTLRPNLWVNSGHGTLGWTLACGSGRLLADLFAGRPTLVAPEPYVV